MKDGGADGGNSPQTAQTSARLADKGIPMSDAGVSGGVAGKEADVSIFFAGLARQLYQLAQTNRGPQAPHQSAI
jgi:6-phosphogluconate dehydrogenase (decarboxylating)